MKLQPKKKVFFDFEYNTSNEERLNVLCCSLQIEGSDKVKSYWLHNSPEDVKKLSDWMFSVRKKVVFVSYGINAEARAMYAMGLNPHDFKFLDLYTLWRQLTYNNNSCEYGTYFVKGTNMKRKSVPPSFDARRNLGKDNTPMGKGLVDCVAHELGVNLDILYKNSMRDLILECKPEYSLEEQEGIIKYCESDIKYLSQILETMTSKLAKALFFQIPNDKDSKEFVEETMIHHSRFCAATAIMESVGIPIDKYAMDNLIHNSKEAKNKLISDLCENYYPFFENVRKRKTRIEAYYVDKYENFASFIENHKLIDATKWPRTDTNKYKTDDKTLESWDGIPELKAYRQVKKIIGQLKWLKEDDNMTETIYDSIGHDNRLRTFFGVFGTQTGRNAPAAKRFILAMSAWLRCLIRAPKGRAVTEVDFSSQEFYVGAILSNDHVMLQAYASGDPYVFFGKLVGMIPKEGNKHTHKAVRELIKSTCLGVQYGMGLENLQKKLTSDSGRFVSLKETERLLNYHKKTFKIYWRWLETIDGQYSRKKALLLLDNWALLGDNSSSLSVRNWPVQGTGGSVLREAVIRAQKEGIMCIASLHDAIYIEHDAGDTSAVDRLKEIMIETTMELLNTETPIRVESETHTSEEVWISGKGKQYYELLKDYLEARPNPLKELREEFLTDIEWEE